MATNFSARIGEIGLFTFIRRPGIRKRIAISHFWLKQFICDNLATSCKHLVNFGSVTPEFKRVKGAHLLFEPQLGYVAEPLLNPAGISTEFSWAIITRFVSRVR